MRHFIEHLAAMTMVTPNPTKRPSQINGSRPSPLKIHKPAANSGGGSAHRHHMKRKPIIIYTHSPKIIHTQPRDFMALVQNLTGMTPSSAANAPPASDPIDNDSSSVLTDENSGGGGFDSVTNHVIDSMFGDVPLFTPNSSADFFCSPRFPYRFSDVNNGGSYSSPNSLSPSILQFMKGLPEY